MRHNMLISGSGGGSPVYFQQDLSSTERDVANWDGPRPYFGVLTSSISAAPRTTGANTGIAFGCMQSDSYTGGGLSGLRLTRTILDTPQTPFRAGDVFNVTGGLYWDDDRTAFGNRLDAYMYFRVFLLDTEQSTDDFGFSDPAGGANLAVDLLTTENTYSEVGAIDEDFTIPSGQDYGVHIQAWYRTRETPSDPGSYRGVVISDMTLTKVSSL